MALVADMQSSIADIYGCIADKHGSFGGYIGLYCGYAWLFLRRYRAVVQIDCISQPQGSVYCAEYTE